MIESVLHLLKIHRKMIFGNTAIVVQNMFCKTPKSLNAINMIFRLPIDERFRVTDQVMFSETLERVITPKRVSVVDRTLSCFLSDNRHKFILADVLNNSRIDPSITLQKAKYDTFASCSSSAFPLAPAAEVRLIQFNLAVQFFAFKLSNVIDRFTKTVVYSRHRLIVKVKIVSETIRRLLFIESSHDCNFLPQLLQRFLFSTVLVSATNVSTFRSAHPKRPAQHAFSSSQKVGRTTEYIVFSHTHETIVPSHGYESH